VDRTGSRQGVKNYQIDPRSATRSISWDRQTGTAEARTGQLLVPTDRSGTSAGLSSHAGQNPDSCVSVSLLTLRDRLARGYCYPRPGGVVKIVSLFLPFKMKAACQLQRNNPACCQQLTVSQSSLPPCGGGLGWGV
jgi:hypothetical protein